MKFNHEHTFKDFERFNRYLVGFDRLVNEMVRIGESPYPPHNIRKLSDTDYQIELAVAGYSDRDIDVRVENNVLTVASAKQGESENDGILHRGIASRAFTRSFILNEDIIVNDASLKDGLLRISLTREIPESKRPRSIPINSGKTTARFLSETED